MPDIGERSDAVLQTAMSGNDGLNMRTDLFDFELPAENIALRPASPRDSARLLVVQPGDVLRDQFIADLPKWLEPGDQLVVNDTKVISAQLKGRRIGRDTEDGVVVGDVGGHSHHRPGSS